MRNLKLTTTQSSFDRLHEAADGRGEFAKVKKSDMRALLGDHSKLYDAAEGWVSIDGEKINDTSR